MKWVLQEDRFFLQGPAGMEAVTTTRRIRAPASPLHVEDLRRLLEWMGTPPSAVVGMEQVHGTSVQVVTNGGDAVLPACDGVVTDRPGIALVMRSADCLPLIAFDPVRRVVGVAHAGWRGIKAGIPERLLALFFSRFQSSAADVHVAIGPAIGPCCYEVGSEFEAWFPGQVEVRHGKKFLDLKKAAVTQMNRSGISSRQIAQAPWCSSCERELCFSYRREGAGTGRMITCARISSS